MFHHKCAAAPSTLIAVGIVAVALAEDAKATDKGEIANSIGMKLMLVPSGEFMMGSGESPEATSEFFKKNYTGALFFPSGFKDEHPQHRVQITHPFYLGKFHVTRGQFRQFVDATKYKTDSEKAKKPGAVGWDSRGRFDRKDVKYSWRETGFDQIDKEPVVNVTWNDAMEFCKWLSAKDRKSYRLPTEAEWEYACRAGTTTRYYNGDNPNTVVIVGNVADKSFAMESFTNFGYLLKASDGYTFTSPVGQFKPNAFGLYDMHGNAFQWCMDWYEEKYYATSPKNDPPGPEFGKYRVLRGGSWYDGPLRARSCDRYFRAPDEPTFNVGFRVVRSQ
jgi:formylglycine-generating enzyme required for sulfatase activity